MWLFTKYGFISAVNARLGGPNRSLPPDPNKIVIRARVRSHMQNVFDAFPGLLGKFEINEDTVGRRDYKYIAIAPKLVWIEVVSKLANEMDYPKFKPSVIEFDGMAAYRDSLLDVWQVMYETQE
jgi:hypothetical protein